MSTEATERVVVGKHTMAAEGGQAASEGQLSIFPLPEDFVWLKHFSARYLAEFFKELFDALQQGQQTSDWTVVTDVIESWKATANIESDPIAAKDVNEGLLELINGDGVSWSSLCHELDL